MGRTVEALADRVIVTSDNPRFESVNSIINDTLGGMERPGAAQVQPDRASAIIQAIASSGPGDIVLIAGKGVETWQEIGEQKVPFSDVATVRSALEAAA